MHRLLILGEEIFCSEISSVFWENLESRKLVGEVVSQQLEADLVLLLVGQRVQEMTILVARDPSKLPYQDRSCTRQGGLGDGAECQNECLKHPIP